MTWIGQRRCRVVTIFATGSEVEIAMKPVKECLEANGHTTRVVSVPSFDLFEAAEHGV
jgi:transketolase